MNNEHLNHIAALPGEITVQDALQLEELTKKFPFFPIPHILLLRYYFQTKDYRFEDLLQKTALRVPDREWLYNFVHTQKIQEQKPELELVISKEGILETSHADLSAEGIEFGNLPDEIDEPTTEIEISTPGESVSLSQLQSMFEIDFEGIKEELTHQTPVENEDFVYEEISGFDENSADTAKNNSEIAIESEEPDLPFQLSNAMISPDTLDDSDIQQEETPVEPETQIEEVGVFESGFLTENATEVIEEAENDADVVENESLETGPKEDVAEVLTEEKEAEAMEIQPFLSESPKVFEPETEELLPYKSAGVVYNIEDYYPASNENEEPSDFFSWLSHPKNIEKKEAETDSPVAEKEDLISKFLRTNPGISRPKNDFFNPVDVAKRSDVFPEELATETLANVYLGQNNPAAALRIFEKLIVKFPEKSAYFAPLIQKLKKEHDL